MPKLKENEQEKKNRLLAAYISKYMTLYGYKNIDDLAIKWHMKRSTAYNRLKNPSKINLGEIRILFDVLHFTDEERLSVM